MIENIAVMLIKGDFLNMKTMKCWETVCLDENERACIILSKNSLYPTTTYEIRVAIAFDAAQ